jgi:hypothetical protein
MRAYQLLMRRFYLLQSDLGQRDLIPVGFGASVIRGHVHMAFGHNEGA